MQLMCARVFYYTGNDPDLMTDDQLIVNYNRIMFCLSERGELQK